MKVSRVHQRLFANSFSILLHSNLEDPSVFEQPLQQRRDGGDESPAARSTSPSSSLFVLISLPPGRLVALLQDLLQPEDGGEVRERIIGGSRGKGGTPHAADLKSAHPLTEKLEYVLTPDKNFVFFFAKSIKKAA